MGQNFKLFERQVWVSLPWIKKQIRNQYIKNPCNAAESFVNRELMHLLFILRLQTEIELKNYHHSDQLHENPYDREP